MVAKVGNLHSVSQDIFEAGNELFNGWLNDLYRHQDNEKRAAGVDSIHVHKNRTGGYLDGQRCIC